MNQPGLTIFSEFNWILFFILLASFIVAALTTYFIAHRIGKSISPKYKRWVYLVTSILPLKELSQTFLSENIAWSNPYIWFWAVFWIFCMTMFIRLRGVVDLRQEDAK